MDPLSSDQHSMDQLPIDQQSIDQQSIDQQSIDQLGFLFKHHRPQVRGFFADVLCQATSFEDGVGYLHLLRSGSVSVSQKVGSGPPHVEVINEPSVLFYPRAVEHHLTSSKREAAELVCASVDFGPLTANPLIAALPESTVIPIKDLPALTPVLELLFDEAFSDRAANQVAIDYLMGYFLVLLLRQLLQQDELQMSVISALRDARLARALCALHEYPERDWNLERVADEAGMSRARFAVLFRDVVGQTPMDYLTDWRISLTKIYLLKGDMLKLAARKVGYQNAAALSRVFKRKTSLSPSEWLAQH